MIRGTVNGATFRLSRQNWSQVEDLLADVLEHPPAERVAFLRRASGADPALALEVESLLEAHTQSGEFLAGLDPNRIRALLDAGDEALVDTDVGAYRIIRPLGRGGMGVVYLALDTRLDRQVAVKVLPARLVGDPKARRRLVDEARAAAALDHPNIGVVYETGETGEGQPFIAMAYYEGETLAERLRRERLPVALALRLIGQIARGLAAAHAHGCVHCDVKPSNILVTMPGHQSAEGSVVKIVDFGIARHLGEERTEGGATAGTVAYMAPERTSGGPPDVRTDLWSIGVVLYEMLTGRLPFREEDGRSLVNAIRHREPDPVENVRPDVSPALAQIILKCLQKDPGQRYVNVGAMLADLDRLEGSRSPESRPRRSGRDGGLPGTGGRVAVLPLDNLSQESGHDYFAVGMTQELISRLSKLSGLRVVGCSATMRFAGSSKRIADIGLELGVSAVLAGNLRKEGDAFRISVELVDAVSEEVLWTDAYDAGGRDAFAVQRRIAERVVEALHIELNGEERSRLAREGTTDQAAYEHYLRGRYHVDRFDEPSVVRARTHFQQALDLDPAFAEAWAGLADTYKVFEYLSLLSPHDAAARARAAAERALALDPDLAAAHTSLATVLCDYYWDWDEAGRHFRRAVELDPGYATGHQLYAEFLRDWGLFDDAMDHIQKAQELDPLSPFYQLVAGLIALAAGRPDETLRQYERLIEAHPGYDAVHLYRGLAYLHTGQGESAIASFDAYDPRCEIPDAVGMRSMALVSLDRVEDARGLLHRLDELSVTRYVSPFHRAMVYLSLGEVDQTLDFIEQSVAERSWFVRLLGNWTVFDPLRSHPRFQKLLATVGLDRHPAVE